MANIQPQGPAPPANPGAAPPPPNPAVAAVQNQAQDLLNQNQLQTANRIRERLKQHAKTIGECDGTNCTALRRWIQAVDRTKVWIDAPDVAIIEMVVSLMTGPLATHLTMVKEAANGQVPPQALTWDEGQGEVSVLCNRYG